MSAAPMNSQEKRELLERDTNRPVSEILSFAQERLWFLDQLHPGAATYNIPTSLPIAGHLNVDAVKRALTEIVRRHETLRTTFSHQGHQPIQLIWPRRAVRLKVEDLRSLDRHQQRAAFERVATEAAFRPFDLARGPLLRTVLVRLGEWEHTLLVTMHHIVSDGWSMNVFSSEFEALYAAYAAGHPSPLAPLAIQYRDYARRQRQQLDGDTLERHLGYWRTKLAGAPELIDLPTDRRRPAVLSFTGWVQPFSLPSDVTKALRALTKDERATAFMTLLAAFTVFLYQHTGETDLVLGAPVANRDRPDLEPLIGFFVNTLIVRADLSGDPTFREHLRRVRELALEAYEHQKLPVERIIEDLQPERDLSRNPLFQVAFTLQPPAPGASDGEEGSTGAPFETHTAKFDLTLGMGETANTFSGALEANADLFDADTVRQFTRRFRHLLSEIAADPDRPISWLPTMPDDERTVVLKEWNDTDRDYQQACFHELFERQVDATPAAIAAEFEGATLTYAELDERANQLAHYLIRMGATPEGRVAVCVRRGHDIAVTVLGVMKAGAAYVPLDTTAPVARSRFILDDAGAEVVVTQSEFTALFDGTGRQVVTLDVERSAIEQQPTERPGVAVDPLNLAYVIYTSGSTGVPKGIMVPHLGVCNMAAAEVRGFGTRADDRVLQTAPLIFDVSIWEMSMAWPVGAAVVFAVEDDIVSGRTLTEGHITVAAFTPSLLATLEPGSFPDLRIVISVGEACTKRIVETWAPHQRLINVYGPTETTGHCSTTDLHDDGSGISIGRPIDNVKLYVLNDSLEPVPIGVAGELHVSSPGITRGYVNRPDLTAERFVPDPFSEHPGARLYRTGDRVRYLPDGRLEYLGRFDHQVKIRGFRIELGEIETALAAMDGVAEVVAVAREDRPGDRRLVAYVVGEPGATLDVDALRHELRSLLPTYMVPAHLVELAKLPLNPNRKVDREALPVPGAEADHATDPATKAGTETEAIVAAIWQDVLAAAAVGTGDNFFDLGGNSLLATQVLVRLFDTLHVEIPMRAMLLGPTVRELAAVIDEALAAGGAVRSTVT